jgi:hypothetical protein
VHEGVGDVRQKPDAPGVHVNDMDSLNPGDD